MKKKIVILVLAFVIIALTAVCIISLIVTEGNIKNTRIDFNQHSTFDVAAVYQQSIYYIGSDNFLYKASVDLGKAEKYSDTEMQLFAFNENYFLYIDMTDSIHIISQTDKSEEIISWNADESVRTTKGFCYTTFSDYVIYEDRIIFRTKDRYLACLFLDNLKIKILSKDKVYNMVAYEDKIVYKMTRDRFFWPHIIKEFNPLTESINILRYNYVLRMEPYNNYIYYIDNYSLYRMNMDDYERELLIFDNSITSFKISESKLFCMSSEGLISANLDGTDKMVLDINRCGPINSLEDMFVYFSYENSYFKIYSENIDVKIDYDNYLLNAVFIDNFLFVRYGTFNEKDIKVTSVEFYDLLGNCVYKE